MATITSTELAPGMNVRRTNDSGLMWRVTGNAFRTVTDAQFRNGWVHVRFMDGTALDARPTSSWEVQP